MFGLLLISMKTLALYLVNTICFFKSKVSEAEIFQIQIFQSQNFLKVKIFLDENFSMAKIQILFKVIRIFY